MKKTTTIADLVLSAQAAANKAFKADTEFARREIQTAEFKASGFEHADFPTWENAFNDQSAMLANFSKQDSLATAAAKKAPKGTSVNV